MSSGMPAHERQVVAEGADARRDELPVALLYDKPSFLGRLSFADPDR